jgi:hypothetical protein
MVVYEHHAYELFKDYDGRWWASVYNVGDSPSLYGTIEEARAWAIRNLPS